MSTLRVNQIQGNTTPYVQFTNGCDITGDIPSGLVINTVGVGTFSNLNAEFINSTGICTATVLEGDGSQLTNLPGTTTSKSVGLFLIQN